MIRYELVGMDLADVRFAVSPLNELVLSLRAWRDPGRYPLHLRWLHTLDEERAGLDVDTLLALTNDRLWTPDFLNPRPHSPLTRIDDELARLANTDPVVVRHDLRAVHRTGPLPRPLRGPAPRVLARICVPSTDTGGAASNRTGPGCGPCWKATSPIAAGRSHSADWRRCSPVWPRRCGS
jgi:hypothetical protein